MAELLRRDQLRAKYIQAKLSVNSGSGTDGVQQSAAITLPTTLGSALDTLAYVITVSIGTPAMTQAVMIDTGSDVSWVHCHARAGAGSSLFFDPGKSSTYTPFSCSSAACTRLEGRDNGCSLNSTCQYTVRYGDGSNTTGTYGSDTLALNSTEKVENFQFGCSETSDPGEGLDEDQTDGLMGLGGGAPSLVSQTAATYGSAFSYCLPATTRSSGFLTLGASTGTSGFVTTPMFRSRRAPTFYFVILQGINVGGDPVAISPTVFAAGSIMDSGTIITRLPPRAYSALSAAFRAGMRRYPRARAFSILDTCFDFTGQDNVSIPAVELVFSGGAVVDLDADGIMYGSCLAFAPATGGIGSIIGNVQQRTFEVLHDVGQSVLGFRPGAC